MNQLYITKTIISTATIYNGIETGFLSVFISLIFPLSGLSLELEATHLSQAVVSQATQLKLPPLDSIVLQMPYPYIQKDIFSLLPLPSPILVQ